MHIRHKLAVKNVEALFPVLAASAVFATCAMAAAPQHPAERSAIAMQARVPMPVVVIQGQRPSAAQKAAL